MNSQVLFGIFLSLTSVYAQTCNLILPKEPLTTKGLSTPFIYYGTGCDETNSNTNSFVEALILNKKTGELVAYSPLIINNGTQPLFPIVKPNFKEEDHIVGLWFGSNANVLVLQDIDNGKTLKNAHCINGKICLSKDTFGQVAGCNNIKFFEEANKAIKNGKLIIPKLGIGLNGKDCPTIRSFTVVDNDQSDNVVTSYLTDGVNIAQDTPINTAANGNLTVLKNGSDNRLLNKIINSALGCQAMQVIDISSGMMRTTQGTNELQAVFQQKPVALIPPLDEMVLVNGNVDLQKINDYRKIVNQPQLHKNTNLTQLSVDYCTNLINVGTKSLLDNQQLYLKSRSPNTDTNLFDFLGQRQLVSFDVLNCLKLLNIVSPITVNGIGNVTITLTTIPDVNGTNCTLQNSTYMPIVPISKSSILTITTTAMCT